MIGIIIVFVSIVVFYLSAGLFSNAEMLGFWNYGQATCGLIGMALSVLLFLVGLDVWFIKAVDWGGLF